MPPLHQAKHRRFSLMEMMVVLALVSLVAGISIFSIIPLYRTICFQVEVAAVYDLMQELQLEALTLQSDIELSFTKKDGRWSARSLSEEAVLKSQVIDLAHIDGILLDQEIPRPLTFYSNGLIAPCGTMLFSYQNERRWLDFSHPLLIKLLPKPPKKFKNSLIPDRDKLRLDVEKEKPCS